MMNKPTRIKALEVIEAVQEFMDTNPNEISKLAESKILIGALEEILGNEVAEQCKTESSAEAWVSATVA